MKDVFEKYLLLLRQDRDDKTEHSDRGALTFEERSALAVSRAAARGEFATDAQVRAVWVKHGL
ncbi:MAG: hypothetical protein M3Z96_07370 [Pseudomonadota bacterium]|nr:hypothetical protein [Pseudomonadota bacterium]